MYRLLIVDDEPAIVEGLALLFSEVEGMDLDVMKAHSGLEAVAIAGTTKLDIVLSDIRMPGMNGIQLMDEIGRCWPSCRFVMLTGYDQFDYIYTAVQKRADAYLLKTEEDAVVVDAVRHIVAACEEGSDRECTTNHPWDARPLSFSTP